MNPETCWRWLPNDQFAETLELPDAADRIVGGRVWWRFKEIQFICGDLLTFHCVPLSWFQPCGDGTKPEFEKLAFDDYGGTIALGEYEVSERSILYEFDPDFRRRADEARRKGAQHVDNRPKRHSTNDLRQWSSNRRASAPARFQNGNLANHRPGRSNQILDAFLDPRGSDRRGRAMDGNSEANIMTTDHEAAAGTRKHTLAERFVKWLTYDPRIELECANERIEHLGIQVLGQKSNREAAEKERDEARAECESLREQASHTQCLMNLQWHLEQLVDVHNELKALQKEHERVIVEKDHYFVQSTERGKTIEMMKTEFAEKGKTLEALRKAIKGVHELASQPPIAEIEEDLFDDEDDMDDDDDEFDDEFEEDECDECGQPLSECEC